MSHEHSFYYEIVKKRYESSKYPATIVGLSVMKGWITEEEREEILKGEEVECEK